MTDKDKKQLEYELRHIFESGANELRVYEMVVNFIQSRELVNKTNDIHSVSESDIIHECNKCMFDKKLGFCPKCDTDCYSH